MKYIAAYALLELANKKEPTADDIEKLLKEAGCKCDSAKVATLIEKLKGKKFHERCAEGLEKIGKMGTGAPAAGGAAATGGAAAAKVEEEAPKEEEEDVDMGGLFGDDEDDY